MLRSGAAASAGVLLCMWVGCAPRSSAPVTGPAAVLPGAQIDPPDPPRRPGKSLVMIAMPDSDSFRTVRQSLLREIRHDLDVVTTLLDRDATAAQFESLLDAAHPDCAVLMNNTTVNLYRAYQNQRRGKGRIVPVVIVMSSFLEELQGELDNATGVAFEVPGVTAFVQLRSILDRPLHRVAVIHRPAFGRFVQRQAELASREQITLLARSVPNDATPSDVRRAVARLKSAKVDALWVLNDNRLLKDSDFLEDGWQPAIGELGIPVIVGVPALVNPEVHIGTLAVLPDLGAMGVQTANILLQLANEHWEAKGRRAEQPISTLTFVNMKEAGRRFGLRPGALERIDRKVE